MERCGCHRTCDAGLAAGVKLYERAHPSVNGRRTIEARHRLRAATLCRLPRGGRAERKSPVTGLLSPAGDKAWAPVLLQQHPLGSQGSGQFTFTFCPLCSDFCRRQTHLCRRALGTGRGEMVRLPKVRAAAMPRRLGQELRRLPSSIPRGSDPSFASVPARGLRRRTPLTRVPRSSWAAAPWDGGASQRLQIGFCRARGGLPRGGAYLPRRM